MVDADDAIKLAHVCCFVYNWNWEIASAVLYRQNKYPCSWIRGKNQLH